MSQRPLSPADVLPVEPPAYSPDLVTFCHFTHLHDLHGAMEMGRVAEGVLLGLGAALAMRIGPEAAYAMFQRHADEIASRLIEDAP